MPSEAPRTTRAWTERGLHLGIAAVFLVLGMGVVLYTGPGRAWIRGSLGDVLVVPFLIHGLGVLVPRHHAARIGLVAVVALGTELLQLANLVSPSSPAWLHLTVGSTFDPWDLLGYTVGIAISAGIAWLWTRSFTRRGAD